MAWPLSPDPLLIQARQHEGGSRKITIQQARAKSKDQLLNLNRSDIYPDSFIQRIARHPYPP